jgi:tol-pal system protein YbgF
MRGLIIFLLSAACCQALAQPQDGGNDLLLNMYNQLEALRSEMQTLRGIVEEQGFQLRQLQQESRDRYLDLDQRLSASGQAQALPGSAPIGLDPVTSPGQGAATGFQASPLGIQGTPPAGQTSGGLPASTQPQGTAAGTTAMNEDELYNSTLNLLLEERRYEESAARFQQYIDMYPNGRLFPNALYWQGEALILLQRLPQARDVFMRVMNEFPQHGKAAAAMLKLGVVYSQMGNRAQAEQLWRELPTRYPDSSPEIREAERFLRQ